MEKLTSSKLRKECVKHSLLPCLFNIYVEYIMWSAGLDEGQIGIKIAWRNTKKFRYVDDTTPMAESEEELKSLLIKVKEENEKAGLKLNIQKTKIMASGPITSWQMDEETLETMTYFTYLFIFFLFWWGELQNHCRWWLEPWNLKQTNKQTNKQKRFLLAGKKHAKLHSILKNRDITLLTKVHLVKAMVFLVVMCVCESCTINKADHWRINDFELWC